MNSRAQGWLILMVATLAVSGAGCASMRPISGIPAQRLPPELLGEPRAAKETIDYVKLRQDPPTEYLLDARDVLGIYIEGVLGEADKAPPVQYSDQTNLPPSIGFPTPVREDGTISLPLVPPIELKGLTVAQAEEKVRKAFTVDRQILKPGQDRIIVTLMRSRTYQVLVIRQDQGSAQSALATAPGTNQILGVSKQGAGYTVDLPAYENDLMHALARTGGLPGLDAKNEVVIYRGLFSDAQQREAALAQIRLNYDRCRPCPVEGLEKLNDKNIVRIPIRYLPGNTPQFSQQDIILKTGDIIVIEARERDVFYTGGLLNGGEFQLPRDYDLDVLGAISLAGGEIGAGVGGRNTFGYGTIGSLIPPSDVLILRNVEGCGEIPIKIDLNRALINPAERILIQPGDVIILRYKPTELIGNILLSTIRFDFLFNGFQRF